MFNIDASYISGFIVSPILAGLSIYYAYKYHKLAKDDAEKLKGYHKKAGETHDEALWLQKLTRSQIANITGLVAASEKLGIKAAYRDRNEALFQSSNKLIEDNNTNFIDLIKNDPKLIIIGSSLQGLRSFIPNLNRILAQRQTKNLETKFMLTHPCCSYSREGQERRELGAIHREINEMVSVLEGLKNMGVNLANSLRFYHGAPTCFLLITSQKMIVNPYPYQIEAYKTFCLEVERIPVKILNKSEKLNGEKLKDGYIPNEIDSERYKDEFLKVIEDENEYDYRYADQSDIFGQFYWYHYLLPWFSKEAISYEEFKCEDKCQICLKRIEEKLKEGNVENLILEKCLIHPQKLPKSFNKKNTNS